MHTLMLDEDGTVWSCGDYEYGQLGKDPHDDTRHLRPLTSITGTRILQIAAGRQHSLLLTATGGVLAFGDDMYSQLGVGSDVADVHPNMPPEAPGYPKVWVPTPVPGFAGRRVVEVSAGAFHSAAVDEMGALWTWGQDENGKLGHNIPGRPVEPDWRRPERVLRPMRVEALRHVRIASVSAGVSHTLAVVVAGELYAWGEGDFGKLGLDDMNGRTTPQLVTACQKVLDVGVHAIWSCEYDTSCLVCCETMRKHTSGSQVHRER